ncbi:hypothetical protein BDN67DRAFT_971812 [Paxillus ammoniavirescens]|nr:hypothetical protein BDN67DRAFT_971812 [Paxillus ammoniavirescens]
MTGTEEPCIGSRTLRFGRDSVDNAPRVFMRSLTPALSTTNPRLGLCQVQSKCLCHESPRSNLVSLHRWRPSVSRRFHVATRQWRSIFLHKSRDPAGSPNSVQHHDVPMTNSQKNVWEARFIDPEFTVSSCLLWLSLGARLFYIAPSSSSPKGI